MDLPESAPAFSNHGTWGVFADVSNSPRTGIQSIHGLPEIAPAFPAFGPSMDCRKLLLHFQHSVHPWTAGNCSCISSIQSIHGLPEIAPAFPAFSPSMDIKKEGGPTWGTGPPWRIGRYFPGVEGRGAHRVLKITPHRFRQADKLRLGITPRPRRCASGFRLS
jgi:hypothetical protein